MAAVYEPCPPPASRWEGEWEIYAKTAIVCRLTFRSREASSTAQGRMTTETEKQQKPVLLTEDDVAYLLSILRDPAQTQPITTQQLIDALRVRSTQ